MRIAVVGAGAMGSLFAAFLSKAKQETWLITKTSALAEKIGKNGLSVTGVSGNWQVKINAVSETKEIPGPVDLIIIAVKSYDTKEAIKKVKPLSADNTQVLTLQNGLGNIEIIGEVIGSQKVIGGLTNQGATLLESGCIRHAGKGETIIGRSDGKIPVGMRAIREAFNNSGLETKITKDINGILWSKLVINAAINPLTAITRLNNGKLTEFEFTRRILQEAAGEALRVAKRKRIKLVFDDPLAKVEAVCEATSANVSSMLQDVLKKKRTEIDFINGVIVRQAQGLGIAVPVNAMLVDLVKTIEASYGQTVGPYPQKQGSKVIPVCAE